MTVPFRTGSLLTVLALSVVGCDPAEPQAEDLPKHVPPAAGGLGPPSPPPPVMPSVLPPMPSPSKSEMKSDMKSEESKDLPKPDIPK